MKTVSKKSVIFSTAHRLVRECYYVADTYQQAFGAAVSDIYASLKAVAKPLPEKKAAIIAEAICGSLMSSAIKVEASTYYEFLTEIRERASEYFGVPTYKLSYRWIDAEWVAQDMSEFPALQESKVFVLTRNHPIYTWVDEWGYTKYHAIVPDEELYSWLDGYRQK